MFKDITLGQYYPVSSVLHALDPRTKLAGTMIFLISLFVNASFTGYGYAILFLAAVICLSKVPFSYMTRGLKSILVIVVFSVILTCLYTKTGKLLFSFWIFEIYSDGIRMAIFLVFRIVLLIIGSTILTLTTTPNRLTDGLETGLSFLKVVHFPVHSLAMIMSIALRFIPILTEETDKIMRAQTARCASFSTGGLIKRVKSYIPLFIPLIISAFRRAADLAQAMDARCYHGGEGRTKYHPLVYKKADHLAYLLLLLYLLGMIGIRVLGSFITIW